MTSSSPQRDVVRVFGVTANCSVTMDNHVDQVGLSWFFLLRLLKHVLRPHCHRTRRHKRPLICSAAIACLDYADSTIYGILETLSDDRGCRTLTRVAVSDHHHFSHQLTVIVVILGCHLTVESAANSPINVLQLYLLRYPCCHSVTSSRIIPLVRCVLFHCSLASYLMTQALSLHNSAQNFGNSLLAEIRQSISLTTSG